MTTKGQTLTATLRTASHVNSRTRDRRDGFSIKADMLESIEHALYTPGWHSEERAAILRTAAGTLFSYRKHVDGYRVDGMVRYQITGMSPWSFAGFLGQMVDAGVTNVGEGEQFFSAMAHSEMVTV